MTKITYLLGAGASAKALPTVKQIKNEKRISKSAIRLGHAKLSDNEFFKINGVDTKETKWFYQRNLIDDLNWLQEIGNKHASIDTYAKKLTIRGKYEELDKLKIVLSIYLALEQLFSGYDERYDSFFASIIDADGCLPDNVNILTWNYDNQIEMAYSEFSGQTSIDHNTKLLGILTKDSRRVKPNALPIYRINGVGGYKTFGSKNIYSFLPENSPLSNDILEKLICKYVEISTNKNILPGISFAWEGEPETHSMFKEIEESIKDSEILVIIGYSFPFFNRKIDKKIFGLMKNLRKIYYQDLYAPSFQDRLKGIVNLPDKFPLLAYQETDQFLLPYEF
ncbi:hypothetical protein [Pareuzebyella sediminis]|uniref:hypothetical protein n=1 Tax=Pareuzebyella sediminis TaxID=2607998 RepID=UPI0011ED93D2|nr:hypothetical protein [Pareuzebyella sediminis]